MPNSENGNKRSDEISRRAFLGTSAGAAATSLLGKSARAQERPSSERPAIGGQSDAALTRDVADVRPPPVTRAAVRPGSDLTVQVLRDLDVETSNFAADKWGTHTGIDSSAQKKLVERFTMSDDGLYLTAEITVTDPVYFTEPVVFTHRWRKLADREVIQAPCTMESALLYLEAGRDQSGAE